MAEAAEVTETTENAATETEADIASDVFNLSAPAVEQETEATQEQASDPTADAPAAPEKSKAIDLVADDKLFDEKALANKGGLLAARKAILDARSEIRAQHAKANDVYVRIRRRDAKSVQREERGKRYEHAARALYDERSAQFDLLENGNAEQIVEALGKLTKRDGVKLYQEMTDAILANGKRQREKPQPDPEVSRLKKELEELKESIEDRDLGAARTNWLNATAAVIADEKQFPGIAHQVKEGRGEQILDLLMRRKEEGWANSHRDPSQRTVVPDAVLLRELNEQLLPYVPRQPEPKVEQKKQANTQKRLPGSGPNPANASTASGNAREMTEDERLAEIANDTTFVNKLFGLG